MWLPHRAVEDISYWNPKQAQIARTQDLVKYSGADGPPFPVAFVSSLDATAMTQTVEAWVASADA